MAASTHAELLTFLEAHQGEEFVMKSEIAAYFRSHVYLLTKPAMTFHDTVVT